MKGRGKIRIPEAVLEQARSVAAPRPASEQPFPARPPVAARSSSERAESSIQSVKAKVIRRLKKLHPMD